MSRVVAVPSTRNAFSCFFNSLNYSHLIVFDFAFSLLLLDLPHSTWIVVVICLFFSTLDLSTNCLLSRALFLIIWQTDAATRLPNVQCFCCVFSARVWEDKIVLRYEKSLLFPHRRRRLLILLIDIRKKSTNHNFHKQFRDFALYAYVFCTKHSSEAMKGSGRGRKSLNTSEE